MLISIIVITYNSSRYVIKTLESVFLQSFQNIELIVSDDCSSDNTIEICNEWVNNHSSRFVRAIVTQTPHNGGICWNYNHALKQAQGEYIKYIAGDDILESNCIERFVANIQPDTYIYTCITEHLADETGDITFYKTRLPDADAYTQAKYMLRYLYGINGPTLFLERNHLVDVGGFEEKYPLVEDWPIAIRFLTKGYRIGIIDEPLVQWRIYGNSISHSNHVFADSLKDAIHDYTSRYCTKYGLILHKYHHWLNYWIGQNTNQNLFYKIAGYLFRTVDLVNYKRHFCPIPQEPYVLVKSDI